MLENKKSEGLSIWSWILWATSSLAYTIYAIFCQDNFMLIFETSLELLFCVIILVFAIIFRDKKQTKMKKIKVNISLM